jgi:hypothetical protein
VARKKLVQFVFEADFIEDGCTLDAGKEVPCCAAGFRGLPFDVPCLLQDFPELIFGFGRRCCDHRKHARHCERCFFGKEVGDLRTRNFASTFRRIQFGGQFFVTQGKNVLEIPKKFTDLFFSYFVEPGFDEFHGHVQIGNIHFD